jgi:nucleotide-binding universal stress UspA family protein
MAHAIERILVPTDGSPESEAAFPAIMPLVRAYGAEVVVLYVVEDSEAPKQPPERVPAACAALRTAGVRVLLEVRDGEPWEEILRTARLNRANLIAMSTHGRGGLARVIVGSVTEEVLRGSTGPVLVTRPGTIVHDFKKIVAALDGSARSERVLEDMEPLARKMDASVDLLGVQLPAMTIGLEVAAPMLPAADPLPYLRTVATRLESHGVHARAVAAEGPAHDAILRHVADSQASLLCMTTHGRTGLARLLLGSVAEGVLRKATCPVLLRRSVEAAGASPTPEVQGITVP